MLAWASYSCSILTKSTQDDKARGEGEGAGQLAELLYVGLEGGRVEVGGVRARAVAQDAAFAGVGSAGGEGLGDGVGDVETGRGLLGVGSGLEGGWLARVGFDVAAGWAAHGGFACAAW